MCKCTRPNVHQVFGILDQSVKREGKTDSSLIRGVLSDMHETVVTRDCWRKMPSTKSRQFHMQKRSWKWLGKGSLAISWKLLKHSAEAGGGNLARNLSLHTQPQTSLPDNTTAQGSWLGISYFTTETVGESLRSRGAYWLLFLQAN